MLRWTQFLSCLLLAPTLLLGACSTGEDNPSSSDTMRIMVKAAEGGVITAGNRVALAIPPGALAEDTEITLKILPPTDATLGDVFDFGPDGLEFAIPAVLGLRVDPAVAEGKELAVGLEENGRFVALAGSTYANEVVSAPIEHFSRFAIIAQNAGGGGGGSCNQQVADFAPCGGAIEGTWTVESVCLHPFEVDSECAGFQVEMRYVLVDEQAFTFQDGQVSTSGGRARLESESHFPVSCTEGVTCSELSSPWTGTCEGSEECSCLIVHESEQEATAGTYTIDGSRVTLVSDDGDETEYEYCVQGDKLFLNFVDPEDEGFSTLVTLERR